VEFASATFDGNETKHFKVPKSLEGRAAAGMMLGGTALPQGAMEDVRAQNPPKHPLLFRLPTLHKLS
jgi:hypothetical protein